MFSEPRTRVRGLRGWIIL